MKNWIAAAALGAALAAAPAIAPEAAAREYGAPLQVEPGQTYAISLDMHEVIGSAEQNIDISGSQVYRLDILPNNRWRYTPVTFTYGDMQALGVPVEVPPRAMQAMGEGVSAFFRIAADIGFECTVDAYGRCVSWSNWPTWSARVENLVLMADAFARYGIAMSQSGEDEVVYGDEVDETSDAEGGMAERDPTKMWLKMREPVLQSVALFLDGITSESAASAMSTFHPAAAVQGRVMERGVAQRFAEEWTMPFGAPPILVSGELTLERVNSRANTGEFVRRSTVDADSVRAALRAMANTLANDVLAPVRPMLEEQGADADELLNMVDEILPQVGLEFVETTRGTVDLSTGMARETATQLHIVITPPANAESEAASEPITVDLTYTLNIEPGAPETPRLPRP